MLSFDSYDSFECTGGLLSTKDGWVVVLKSLVLPSNEDSDLEGERVGEGKPDT